MEIIIAATAGFTILLPFINALFNRVTWTPKQKSLVAWGTSIVLAIAFVLMTSGFSSIWQLLLAAPAIYGYQSAIYTFFVKNIATKFEAITDKNSTVVTANADNTVTVTTDASADKGTAIVTTPPVTVVTAEGDTEEPAQAVEIVKGNVAG